jgi:hypothetical protein
VVYAAFDAGFTDPKLPDNCNTFTYQFWSHDQAGHFSQAAVIATTVPGGRAAPATPTGFTASADGAHVNLSWALAPQSASTKVVRKLGTPPVLVTEGALVYDGVAATAAEPVDGLPIGQTLFYGAFACNACGACSALPALTSVTLVPDAGTLPGGPDDGGSQLQPMGMSAMLSTDGMNVSLKWTNPDPSTGFTQVKVLRVLNGRPSGPNDTSATVIFTGLASSASEPLDGLLPDGAPPRSYTYVAYGCSGVTCERRGSSVDFSFTVSQALHAGGYTVWWRHSTASTCGDRTDLGACSCSNGTCTNCPSNNWWKSCDSNCGSATARQLTPPQSALETQTIHDAFARGVRTDGPSGAAQDHPELTVPVGRVLSSEYCRGIQTAQGMNFGPAIEQVKELTYFVYDEANRCNNTMGLLNTPPARGTNTAMVSHAGFSCPTIDSLAWGEAAIYKPVPGTSGPLFIARVPYNKWSTLP